MATDKKMKYEAQKLTKKVKPVNQGGGPNYLGKQKEVTVPKKWLSSPDHVVAELAYITPKEQKILLDANIYGSLKGKPNKGPGGIMSLQGDLGGWSSGGGKGGNTGGDRDKGKGGSSREDYKQSNYYKMMTGTGTTATSPTGDTVRSKNIAKGAVPEYVNTPDGMKYVGSAYKDTGRRGLLSRLLGGANRYGYGQTYGTGSGRIFDRKSSIRFNPQTGQYESEEEKVGDLKPGYGGRFFGGLMSLLTGIPFVGGAIGSAIDYGKGIFGKKPRDMSEFNRLGLFGIPKGTLDEDDKIPVRADSAWQDGSLLDRWSTPINRNVNFGNTIAPYSGTQAGDFIKNLNDPNNMASGMQISNDQMNSMINLINSQNNNAGIVSTNAFNNSGTGIDNVTNTDEMNMYYGGS